MEISQKIYIEIIKKIITYQKKIKKYAVTYNKYEGKKGKFMPPRMF